MLRYGSRIRLLKHSFLKTPPPINFENIAKLRAKAFSAGVITKSRRRFISKSLLVFTVLFCFSFDALGDTPFRSNIIDTNFYGDVKAVADIDGDGFVDVMVGRQQLVWYHYPDWTKTVIATATEFTTDMQAGDVDNDGDMDAIVPDVSGIIHWFENPRPGGDPSKDTWNDHIIGSQGGLAHDVEIGDLNNDGKLDVVTRKGITKVWLQSNPDSWTAITVSNRSDEGLSLGDIDGDGLEDLAINGYWIKTPSNPISGTWTERQINTQWPAMAAVHIVDINGDGNADVVLAPSESSGKFAWYESATPLTGPWTEHTIDASVSYFHTFKSADVDHDGNMDLITAEMRQSSDPDEVSIYYNLGNALSWQKQVIATDGSHNIRIADFGNDGDIDIIGTNWQGPPVNFWENQSNNLGLSLDSWKYIQIDNARDSRAFGLAMGDVNGDNRMDIAAGHYIYSNPGGDMTGAWPRTVLASNLDCMLIVNVDDDPLADMICEDLPNVYWLEATNQQGTNWTATLIGTIPATSHGAGQGYVTAQIIPGGKPEIVLSAGDGMYYFSIPANPGAGNWPKTKITSETTEDGIAAGDINGDGYMDIAAGYTQAGTQIGWYLNPTDGGGSWLRTTVGSVNNYADRFAIDDINGDGKLDVIVSEETSLANAGTYWFSQAADPFNANWPRNTLVVQNTTNSLTVADMDNDGDKDIVTGEHRGTQQVAVWENNGTGVFSQHIVDAGKESHLGARVADLDGDGDKDIVSIAWDSFQFLHVWRNDAIASTATPAVATPTISPYGGLFSGTVSVNLSTATPDAAIYYTTDGSLPTTASPAYSGAFALTGDAIVQARAFRAGYQDSQVASAEFTIALDTIAPTIESVSAVDSVTVSIRFSESIDAQTAENPANFTIGDTTHSVTISSAVLLDDQRTVSLTTTALAQGTTYTLTVNNIQDLAATPNTIASDTQQIFQYSAHPRVRDGLVSLYTFDEGGGNMIQDSSGVGKPLDLTISDMSKVSWLPNGNGIKFIASGVKAQSGATPTKIYDALTASNQFSVEAWVTPANISQNGPARIVTLSNGTASNQMDVHLGQEYTAASFRLRTSDAIFSWLNVANAFTDIANPVHLVATYDGAIKRLYINGILQPVSENITGNFSTWNTAYPLVIANEITLDRSWLGTMYLMAIYDKALSSQEIAQNFKAGANIVADPGPTPTVDTPTISPNGGTFSSPIDVTLSSSTAAAVIRYTTDGSTPTSTSQVYTAPFTLMNNTTVKARGFLSGYNDSANASASFIINIDDTPPTIQEVSSADVNTEVKVSFSEPLDPVSAQNTANYKISGGSNAVSVLSAELYSDQSSVLLTTTALSIATKYTLSVNGVQDLATTPNIITPNSQSSFSYSPLRISNRLLALYTFNEGSGSVIQDSSGVDKPLNLTISDMSKVNWLSNGNGLQFIAPGVKAQSTSTPTKIYKAVSASNQITVEAWVTPANTTQNGPARIITLSGGTASNQMNVHLGQEYTSGSFRLRTSNSLFSRLEVANTTSDTVHPVHLVATYDGAVKRLYINGTLQPVSEKISGDFSTWNGTYPLTIANEVSLDRSWLGSMFLVAIYDKALSAQEVLQNFQAGLTMQ